MKFRLKKKPGNPRYQLGPSWSWDCPFCMWVEYDNYVKDYVQDRVWNHLTGSHFILSERIKFGKSELV